MHDSPLARRHRLDRRAELDAADDAQAFARPVGPPSLGETLRREVERCEQRLDAARDDLRRWLLSNSPEAGPVATTASEAK